MFSGDAATVRHANQELLAQCDAAVLFYGAGDEAWKRTVENDLRKALAYRQGKAPMIRLTYLAPPATEDKADLIDVQEPDLSTAFAANRPRLTSSRWWRRSEAGDGRYGSRGHAGEPVSGPASLSRRRGVPVLRAREPDRQDRRQARAHPLPRRGGDIRQRQIVACELRAPAGAPARAHGWRWHVVADRPVPAGRRSTGRADWRACE